MSQHNNPFPPPEPNRGVFPPPRPRPNRGIFPPPRPDRVVVGTPTTDFGAPAPTTPSNRSKRWLRPALAALALFVPLSLAGAWHTNRDNSTDAAEQTGTPPRSAAPSPPTTELAEPTTTTVAAEQTTTLTTEPPAPVATEPPTTVPIEPTLTLNAESAPQLLYSVPLKRAETPFAYGPVVAGSPHDFYVAEAGSETTTVTRFVNGEVVWQSEAGRDSPAFVDMVDSRVIVTTFPSSIEGDKEVVGLNIETGAIEWTITTQALLPLRSHAGRYYLLLGYGAGAEEGEVIELNIVDGAVLNRWVGSSIYPVEIGYGSWDEASSTAQLLDFDLEPVGDPVAIEPNDYSLPTFDRSEAGWVYLVRGGPGTGRPKLITLSPEGERRFDCAFTTQAARRLIWSRPLFIDATTVAAMGKNGVEVFDISGSTCTSLWNLPTNVVYPNEERRILSIEPLIVLTFPVDEDGRIDKFRFGARVDVLDWHTGEPVATGVDELVVQSNGLVVTHDDTGIVARMLVGGEERWHIDAAPSSEVVVIDAMLAVVTHNGDNATLDVYAG